MWTGQPRNVSEHVVAKRIEAKLDRALALRGEKHRIEERVRTESLLPSFRDVMSKRIDRAFFGAQLLLVITRVEKGTRVDPFLSAAGHVVMERCRKCPKRAAHTVPSEIEDGISAAILVRAVFDVMCSRIDAACLNNDFDALEAQVSALATQLKRG